MHAGARPRPRYERVFQIVGCGLVLIVDVDIDEPVAEVLAIASVTGVLLEIFYTVVEIRAWPTPCETDVAALFHPPDGFGFAEACTLSLPAAIRGIRRLTAGLHAEQVRFVPLRCVLRKQIEKPD